MGNKDHKHLNNWGKATFLLLFPDSGSLQTPHQSPCYCCQTHSIPSARQQMAKGGQDQCTAVSLSCNLFLTLLFHCSFPLLCLLCPGMSLFMGSRPSGGVLAPLWSTSYCSDLGLSSFPCFHHCSLCCSFVPLFPHPCCFLPFLKYVFTEVLPIH